MQFMPWERELEIARQAAQRAGEVALRYGEQGLAPEDKGDGTPVTAADRECERMITKMLREAFPEDGLLGEEFGEQAPGAPRRWIIDPIDGTRDYVRGNRNWAVLIGLEEAGEVVAGVCHLPAWGEMYTAWRGGGTYCNDRRVRVSGITSVERAVVCVSGLDLLGDRAMPWVQRFWAVRSMGGCVDAILVASGSAEVWVEPACAPWDLAPLKVILEEAGARFFNLDGGSSIYGGNCVACVPALESVIRDMLGCRMQG
jgi:histidinol phosphatase-like enzyme (inositol monophosphatase family)